MLGLKLIHVSKKGYWNINTGWNILLKVYFIYIWVDILCLTILLS